MQTRTSPIAIRTGLLFRPPLDRWLTPLEPALQRAFIPPWVLDCYWQASSNARGATDFAERLLDILQIRHVTSNIGRIPASGPALAIANHPLGLLEGLVLCAE